MNVLRSKLIKITTALGCFIGAVICGVLMYLKPDFSKNWFLVTFLFFIVQEMVVVSIVCNHSKTENKKQLVNVYMLTKVVKLLTSLFFILIYTLIDGTHIKDFVLVFMTFYFMFLLLETYLFVRIEKQMKINEKNNNE